MPGKRDFMITFTAATQELGTDATKTHRTVVGIVTITTCDRAVKEILIPPQFIHCKICRKIVNSSSISGYGGILATVWAFETILVAQNGRQTRLAVRV